MLGLLFQTKEKCEERVRRGGNAGAREGEGEGDRETEKELSDGLLGLRADGVSRLRLHRQSG